MPEPIALVTGSYKGLGLAIATRLAREKGFRVIISGRDLPKVNAVRDQLAKEGVQLETVALDVTSDASVTAAFAEIDARFGRLDVLVNNAGVNPFEPTEASIETVNLATFDATIHTNATSVLRVLQAALPIMRRRGTGRIVNVSTEMASLESLAADQYPAAISYRISKLALNGIVALAAKELRGTDILINAYSPGWMKTDMGGDAAPFTAEEGAETALFLATLPPGGPSGQFFAEMRRFGGPIALDW